MNPKADATASNSPSSHGRYSGLPSNTITSAPCSRASVAIVGLPCGRSSHRSPCCGASRSTSCRWIGSRTAAIRPWLTSSRTPRAYCASMSDLFDETAGRLLARHAPLAQRLRPQTLDDFVGQQHVIGPGRALRRAIEADRVPSLVLYGPPGSGKTTLARIIANVTGAEFEELSAVSATVSQVREVLAQARERLGANGRRTILFLDEIHRFNKAQQDALLPGGEEGLVTLI